jgi:Ca2+-binding RTX toxin-like protein
LAVSTASNVLDGGAGNDTLAATAVVATSARGEASNVLRGGDGNDVLNAVASARPTSGGDPDDAVARNALRGGDGDDVLIAEIVEGSGASRSTAAPATTASRRSEATATSSTAGAARTCCVGVRTRTSSSSTRPTSRRTTASRRSTASTPPEDRLAFFGVTDAGAPGLADDLDAVSFIDAGNANGDVFVRFDRGSILFRNLTTEDIDSVADLVADPATQLVVATRDMIA